MKSFNVPECHSFDVRSDHLVVMVDPRPSLGSGSMANNPTMDTLQVGDEISVTMYTAVSGRTVQGKIVDMCALAEPFYELVLETNDADSW